MRVEVKHGDVLNERADALICSANVFLNLSGGVGGEILRRYGDSMQRVLHQYLVEHNLKFVSQGDVVRTTGFGAAFNYVFHAVAVDGWYCSSADVVGKVLAEALRQAAGTGATKVASVAIGTGYGRLRMRDFARGLRAAVMNEYAPVELLSVVVPRLEDASTIRELLASTRHEQ